MSNKPNKLLMKSRLIEFLMYFMETLYYNIILVALILQFFVDSTEINVYNNEIV